MAFKISHFRLNLFFFTYFGFFNYLFANYLYINNTFVPHIHGDGPEGLPHGELLRSPPPAWAKQFCLLYRHI